MKEVAKIFKTKYEEKLAVLHRVANIAGKIAPETWDDFMTDNVIEILNGDDDLSEKFVDAAIADLVRELAIKPDPNYKPTEKEKALTGLAAVIAALFKGE